MFTFKFIPKAMFFDRQLVRDKLSKARHKQLQRGGASIKVTAQRSMRYAPITKHSPPGTPPRAHQPTPLLRKHLYFSYDMERDSVVVGSMALNVKKAGTVSGMSSTGKGLVPAIMEFGGSIRLREIQPEGAGVGIPWKQVPATRRLRQERRIPVWSASPIEKELAVRKETVYGGPRPVNFYIIGKDKERIRTARIGARPYMGPALVKNRKKIVGFWVNSIK